MVLLVKTLVSAVLITVIAEVSKRSVWLGGVIASLPLISILSLIWLYQESKDVGKVADLSISIFWMVIPSLVLFVSLPILLKKHVPFYWALGLACILTCGVYTLALLLYGRLGIR